MRTTTLYRVYYENEVGRATDDPLGFARITYREGPRAKEAFQSLLDQVSRLLAMRADGCLLVDQRLMQPFTPEEQAYVINHWLPRAAQASGYRFGAVVVAHNVFARLATSMVVTAVRDLPIIYRYFEEEAEAVAWLLEQQRQVR